jgi:hypothetical protein
MSKQGPLLGCCFCGPCHLLAGITQQARVHCWPLPPGCRCDSSGCSPIVGTGIWLVGRAAPARQESLLCRGITEDVSIKAHVVRHLWTHNEVRLLVRVSRLRCQNWNALFLTRLPRAFAARSLFAALFLERSRRRPAHRRADPPPRPHQHAAAANALRSNERDAVPISPPPAVRLPPPPDTNRRSAPCAATAPAHWWHSPQLD